MLLHLLNPKPPKPSLLPSVCLAMLLALAMMMPRGVQGQTLTNALDFDGSNDKVTIPDNNALDLTTNYTLEAWVYPTQFTNLAGIISKYQNVNTNGYVLRLAGTSGQVDFDGRVTTSNVLTLNAWNHISAVNNGGTRTLYVNGVAVALGSGSFSPSANADPVCLGIDFNDASRSFKGKIDEVRIWNTARTASEVSDGMTRMLQGDETELVAYYRFDQSSGTTLTNQASALGTTLNGTLGGFALSGSTSNWVSGYTLFRPLSTTTAASSITTTTATAGGEVTHNGGASVTTRGSVWNTASAPTVALSTKTSDGSGDGTFTSSLTSLTPYRRYYLRSYATNSAGTDYGNERTFMTLAPAGHSTVANALDFDGTNDKVTIPDNNSLDLTTNYTLEAWVYPTQFTHLAGIISKYQSGFANGYMLRLSGTTGQLDFDERVTTSNVLTLNAWNHIAAVNSGGTRTLYVNGVSVALGSSSFSTAANTDPVCLGLDFNTLSRSFKGMMEEVRIWNVARTSVQINASKDLMLNGDETGLVAYYRFDHGTADASNTGVATLTNLATTTSTALDGTLANFALSGTASNWVPGKVFAPLVTTTTVSSITATTASSGGNVVHSGNVNITARGVVWGTTTGPTVSLSTKTTETVGDGSFTSSLTGLTAGTTYYVRAYATNAEGTSYGTESTFNTLTLPTLTTTAASSITANTASAGGNISSDGGNAVTARGVVWSTSTAPTVSLSTKTTDGTGTGAFTSSITGLSANTTYYIRAYATTAAGTAYGTEQNFTTLNAAPAFSFASPTLTLSTGVAMTPNTLTSTGGVPDKAQVSTLASIPAPIGCAFDGLGNLYVVESQGQRIRKIVLSTGEVSTLAGSGNSGLANGTGTAASFNFPQGIATDANGDLYVADYTNNSIRKIVSTTGAVTTMAGNGAAGNTDATGSAARFNGPSGVAVDGSGNVYVTDQENHRIRKITPAGVVTTLAGSTAGYADATGTSAKFYSPFGITYEASGNLVVSELSGRIRKINLSSLVVTTLAGSGTQGYTDATGSSAQFKYPRGISMDGSGNLYVADWNNHRIRKVTSSGDVTTLAGTGATGYADGTLSTATFWQPTDVKVDGSGNIYVTNNYSGHVRLISSYRISPTLPAGLFFDARTGTISGTPTTAQAAKQYTVYAQNSLGTATTTLTIIINATPTVTTSAATNITASTATLSGTVNANGNATTALTIKYSTSQATVDAGNGTSATVSPVFAAGNTVTPVSAAITGLTAGTTYYFRVSATNTAGTSNGTTLSFNTTAQAPNLSYSGSPITLSLGTAMTTLTPVNTGGAPEPMQVSTLAGSSSQGSTDGTGAAAKFFNPYGVAVDGSGNVYVADQGNNLIRKISSAGVVSTLAGSGTRAFADGAGTAASFGSTFDVAVDASGNVYVADNGNHRIRKITSAGVVSTLAGKATTGSADGNGLAATFYSPNGIAVDGIGNLYVADLNNHRIRKITSAGVVSTLAGSTRGYSDGTGAAAKFATPSGVAVDGSGNVYVADYGNQRIRKITSAGVVTTFAGSETAGYADGTGTAAKFASPYSVDVDGSGNVYVGDLGNTRIRKITPAGVVTTLAGSPVGGFTDGTGALAFFKTPAGVVSDGSGNLYVGDYMNLRIRKISNYSITPSLPAGLSFNTSTGAITGTPTALSAAKIYTVKASNGGGTSTTTFSLSVSYTLLTADVSSIGETTATCGGTVDASFTNITARGVVWGTSTGPTISLSTKTTDGSTSGTFTSSLTGLTPNTTYYVRSYVTYGSTPTTAYGSEKTFKTNALGTFADITKTYGDANFSLTAPTAVSTGAFSFSSSNTGVATVSGREVNITGAGNTTITATQAAAGAYASATKTLTLTVNKATPSLTLSVPTTAPLNQVTGANTLIVSGSSSDVQTVTMSIVSGGATGTLTSTATPGSFTLSNVSSSGIITFEGSVPGNSNYNAVTKQAAMDVTKSNQTITFNPTSPLTFASGLTATLSATTNASGLSVTDFTVVSGPGNITSGNVLNITEPGTIVVKAAQAGNGTYNAAPEVTRSIVVNPGAPVVTSFTPASATTGDVVTITGQYFDNITSVTFGGTAATSFTRVSSTSITAVVGDGHTGSVAVTTTGGTHSKTGFRYKVTWTGATTAFGTASNWSNDRTPQTDDDIIFSASAASDLELDGHKTVGHVDFNGSSRAIRLGAYNLTVKGNLTMPGSISGTGKLIMGGTAAQTITGGGSIPDLEVNNASGVTISGSGDEVNVTGRLRLTSGTLTTNGKLRLSSNNGGTARVGQVTGAITGDVIAERYIKQNQNSGGTGRAWRLVSVPVQGSGTLRDFFMNGRNGQDLTDQTIRDAETENSGTPIVGHTYATASDATTAGFDWIGVANQVSSLRSYVPDAVGGTFLSESVPNLTTTYGSAAQGYMVFTRGDRKLEFPSTNSSSATTFRSTGTLKTGNQTVTVQPASTHKFTLVGNPYMSVLDLSALYASNTSVIEPSFWIWDANIAGTNYQGAYVNVYKSGTQWVTNTGSYINPERIESGMAFLVEPLTTLATSGTLRIAETHKSSDDAAGLSPMSTDKPDDHGRMYVRLERADQQGQRQIIDGVMADFHKDFKDALGDPSDRTKLQNGISRGALWFSRDAKTLSGQGLPWPTATRKSVPLYMSGIGDQTLVVRIEPRGMENRYVKAWLKDNVLKREVEIDLKQPFDYDFLGTGSATWDSTRFELVFVEAGRPSTGGTLEPEEVQEKPSVKLYPNPTRSMDLKLSLRSMPAGEYQVNVLDMTGRLVLRSKLSHRSLNGEYRVLEGRRLSPGKYILQVSQQGKAVQSMPFIQE